MNEIVTTTTVSELRKGQPSPLLYYLWAAALSGKTKLGIEGDSHLIDLCHATLADLTAFNSGLKKWQSHPFRRAVSEMPVIWQRGSTRLLDFGNDEIGKPILIIPSLINRSYILDLAEDKSLLRHLSKQGLRPMLLDWGDLTAKEYNFDLNAYAAQRIIPALEFITQKTSQTTGILGYCMGGTLAAGVISQRPEIVNGFATIGSPWDFDAYEGVPAALQNVAKMDDFGAGIDYIGQVFGAIPSEFFQNIFAQLNPMQAAEKFIKFNNMSPNSPSAHHFIAVEDWLADGVSLAVPAAKNLLIDWNIKNTPINGKWELLGGNVDLKNIRTPTMVICGSSDCITPLDVATPLAASIPNSKLLKIQSGHVGMIVGNNAKKTVWEPLTAFFKTLR